MKNNYKIGEIIWVKLYGKNNIQNGVRPAIIIQNNMGNKHSPTIQVVPLTSRMEKAKLPTHVTIPAGTGNLPKLSIAQCEGARPISKCDILGRIGMLPDEYMARISVGIMISIPIIKYLTQAEMLGIYGNLKVA